VLPSVERFVLFAALPRIDLTRPVVAVAIQSTIIKSLSSHAIRICDIQQHACNCNLQNSPLPIRLMDCLRQVANCRTLLSFPCRHLSQRHSLAAAKARETAVERKGDPQKTKAKDVNRMIKCTRCQLKGRKK